MPSPIRSALTATSFSIPVCRGELALGTWQGLYVFEHRDAPHRREVLMHLIGACTPIAAAFEWRHRGVRMRR